MPTADEPRDPKGWAADGGAAAATTLPRGVADPGRGRRGQGGPGQSGPADPDRDGPVTADRTAAAQLVRAVWRVHFYAALFAAPVLAMMALSGLVIMYSEPLTGLLRPGETRVAPQGRAPLDLAAQEAAAATAAPAGARLLRVVTPKEPDRVSEFSYTAGPTDAAYFDLPDAAVTYVYLDPYTGRVTATGHPGDDLVGLANRLHETLNNDSLAVELPSPAHLIDPAGHPGVVDRVSLGDLVIEVSMGWALVLALSGLYLWWPRRVQRGKPVLLPRWRAGRRLRWRDVHAASGMIALGMLLLFVTSGLPWSDHWGATLSAANATLTPARNDAVASTPVRAGDLDRFGKRIPWDTRETPIPASTPPPATATAAVAAAPTPPSGSPARAGLDVVELAARQEGMLPGYDIVLPVNGSGPDGRPSYGSFQLANPWPGRIQTDKTVYLDQFSGATLVSYRAADSGFIGQATSFGVYVHMGTQFGLLDRVVMTTGVVLVLVSIASSLVMWWLRRPAGGTGLPRRPADPRLPWSVAACGLVLAAIYPLWGASALAVILLDWWVIRRSARLRTVFGMPPVSSGNGAA